MRNDEVFISYARQDRARAEELAEALEEQGWSVFWDPEILPGETYVSVIKRHLETVPAVVVLWSPTSVESPWVRDEAQMAAERNALVPATIEGVSPPLGFGSIQAADLTGWEGSSDHQGFAQLVGGISRLAGSPSDPGDIHAVRRLSGHPDRRQTFFERRWVLAAGAAFVVVISAVGLASVLGGDDSPVVPTTEETTTTAAPPSTEPITNTTASAAGPFDELVGDPVALEVECQSVADEALATEVFFDSGTDFETTDRQLHSGISTGLVYSVAKGQQMILTVESNPSVDLLVCVTGTQRRHVEGAVIAGSGQLAIERFEFSQPYQVTLVAGDETGCSLTVAIPASSS
jgi:hypothetical protein